MNAHNDYVGSRLAEAMMLLEMAMDGPAPFPLPDMLAAAHSLVQSARGWHTGHLCAVSEQAQAMLASIHAANAISDAQERRA